MADPSLEVPLPPSVEQMIQRICEETDQTPPDVYARRQLASLGEQASIDILTQISSTPRIRTLAGFIVFMARQYRPVSTAESICLSPTKCCSPRSTSVSSKYPQRMDGASSSSPVSKHIIYSPSSSSKRASGQNISRQLLVLGELEFRKAFLILSYIGKRKLEDVVSADFFDINLQRMKDLPMESFESQIWDVFGQHYCDESDRSKCVDWDSGKTHVYYCHVLPDGSYNFKGPYLNSTRTHLQRALGEENILIVKFAAEVVGSTNLVIGSTDCNAVYNKIAKEGILVGLRRYRFFVFKDGGKEEKKKSKTSSSVKCFFVRMESIGPNDEDYILSQKTVRDARCLFMHVHRVSSLAKYMARFSLILSTTIKLQVDLASVHFEIIEDIPCRDENDCNVYNDDGERLIHTDGTGYISEDLAAKCPKDFCKAKYIRDGNFEIFLDRMLETSLELKETGVCTSKLPLLMQCRLFNNGCAVKGTLLVNRKLPHRTIQVRRSMVKVEKDPKLQNTQSLNSLEIVAISHKPGKSLLSKNLIALLHYGGVPTTYFLELLTNALQDAQNIFSKKRAALRVSLNNEGIDDDLITSRMILSGVPLNEPCLQHRLSFLSREERKGLKGGRLPISDSFYLMGTVDPTGLLNSDEVCVILENGQISGKVLVYRNPGLHFGDIHILNAIYIKDLEDFVGNAKYGIFFSTKGQRSVASEIANGDFDGDMYWVSRNPQLLNYFRASEPWSRIYPAPRAFNRKPAEFSDEELEYELFQLLLDTRKRSNNMSVAADSWLAFMDRLLTLGECNANEKDALKEKMLKLVDIYYDALDAPKSGKKVEVPSGLKAEMFPHYMERGKSYNSTSVLGQIYDTVESSRTEALPAEEVWKLPCFDVEIPDACLESWTKKYREYRHQMTEVLKCDNESKDSAANELIKKYKQMLYEAAEFEESKRKMEDIYDDALAIYRVTYDYAKSRRLAKYCYFAWKVAGSALCKLYIMKQHQRSIACSPSVLREILN